MIIYPAIDIRDGKAVQLVEGDFDRETVFDADPVDAARRWQDQGAAWIHVVDLDGARDGVRSNQEVIERIRAAVSVNLQLGGGLRDLATLRRAHEAGIDRLVIGSAAISDPDLVPQAVDALGPAIAVGLDARNGLIATKGWREQTTLRALDVAKHVAAQGVDHLVFTDIGRDGRLQGPNLEALREMIDLGVASVIASGGIGSIDDVTAVAVTGAAGVIVGTALYRGRIALNDAIAIGSQPREVQA